MNQIIFNKEINKKQFIKFIIIFIVSIFLCLLLTIRYFITYFRNIYFYNSNGLFTNYYNISTLYSTKKLSSEVIPNELSNIVGVIQIDKINIKYSILASIDDNLLKFSPCKFYGPDANQVGNLCIAGHNYNNSMFFSKLFDLAYGDEIIIYDLNNSKIPYYVYEIYEVKSDDTSCTSQDTNGFKEITLVTCNNINGNRLIVKARA